MQNNTNKISEEINFEIFNEKPNKERKSSYIDINFFKRENKNKYNSERMKNKDNSEFNHILMEKKNSEKINKTKVHFNKSYINIKDYKNNNLVKRYSALPISQKYYDKSNNKNNMIKINNYNSNINNKIFQEPLDCLINKIKNNNNFKGIKNINNNNNSINKKIKDIKDSLQKINDINRQNNKNQNSLNNIYLNILEDSFKPVKKIISRNFILSKRTDSSDFIFYNKNIEHNKIENNISLPSKRIPKKTNSYSNIYTLNNSPIHPLFKNKNIFSINKININNLHLINKNKKIKNLFEEMEPNTNLLKKVNISDRVNSKGNKEDDNKNIIKNKNNKENNNNIRLYFTSGKAGNRNNNNTNLLQRNSSNYKSYMNKINENKIFEEYPELKDYSIKKEKEPMIYFIKQKNIYKKEIENKNKYFNNINNDQYLSRKPNSKYVYNKNNKNGLSGKNKIKQIQNYSQKPKENYNIFYQKYKSKDLYSPFEKLKRKKTHSIFPVNPFDSINNIKINNFFK